MLQAKSNDIYNGLKLIQALKEAVSSLRNIVDEHHQICYEQALKIASKINVIEEKPRTSFISKNRANTPFESVSHYFKLVITIPLLDHLSTELNTRFNDTTLKCYKALVLVPSKMIAEFQCSSDTNWKDHVISFREFYITDLPNPLALLGELKLREVYWVNFKNELPSNITETLKAINFPGFENIKICLKLPNEQDLIEPGLSSQLRINTCDPVKCRSWRTRTGYPLSGHKRILSGTPAKYANWRTANSLLC